jgi:steroid delta-isomerase-like uncharacterized protein
MSAQENKALVERFVEEFWNEGNTSAADELMAPDAEIHMPTGEVVDVDGLKGFAGTFRESFPDWHSTFEELVAEGDRVAERWTGRGTHRGELQGIPPTGKRVEVPGSVFYRIVGGKIVEFRGQLDMMGLMQQLGVIAPPSKPRLNVPCKARQGHHCWTLLHGEAIGAGRAMDDLRSFAAARATQVQWRQTAGS